MNIRTLFCDNPAEFKGEEGELSCEELQKSTGHHSYSTLNSSSVSILFSAASPHPYVGEETFPTEVWEERGRGLNTWATFHCSSLRASVQPCWVLRSGHWWSQGNSWTQRAFPIFFFFFVLFYIKRVLFAGEQDTNPSHTVAFVKLRGVRPPPCSSVSRLFGHLLLHV